jgi:hypothetical protein
MSVIQSVIFDKNYWTIAEARLWLRLHRLTPLKREHTTKRFYRFRINNPMIFKRFITKKIIKDHLDLIIGYY